MKQCVFLVFWVDTDGISHNETAMSKEAANARVLELRARQDVYRAVWDEIDPLKADTGGGV